MLDEIRRHCALLLSEDIDVHIAAYLWLRKCDPFRRLRDRFRAHELSIFEIAACLAPDSNRPLTPIALSMLAHEVERQVNGTCETTPL